MKRIIFVVMMFFSFNLFSQNLNSEYIQKLIDEKKTGEVFLKSGEYIIDKPIKLKYGISLKGEGAVSTVLIFKGEGNCLEIVGDEKKIRHVTIEKLCLKSEKSGNGIYIKNATHIILRELFIGGGFENGIYIDSDSWIIRLENLWINKNKNAGIYISGKANNDINIIGGRIQGNDGYGIYGSVNGMTLTGTNIEGNKNIGLRLLACNGLSINGGYFEKNGWGNTGDRAAHIYIGEITNFLSGPGGNGISIRGCYFYGSNNNTYWAIVFEKASGFEIIANDFSGHVKGGILLKEATTNGIIKYNSFRRIPYKFNEEMIDNTTIFLEGKRKERTIELPDKVLVNGRLESTDVFFEK